MRWDAWVRRIIKGMRKLLGVMDMFIFLIVVMVSWEDASVKTSHCILQRYGIYCMPIIPQ